MASLYRIFTVSGLSTEHLEVDTYHCPSLKEAEELAAENRTDDTRITVEHWPDDRIRMDIYWEDGKDWSAQRRGFKRVKI